MSVYAQEYGYFFNSNNNDRTYNAESFEEWLRPFFVGGVFAGCLQVQAQSTPDMTVTVKPGYANLNGKPAYWPDNNIVEIARASGVYNRIDTVVLRRDNTNRTISIEVVTGNASNNPQPTAPTRNSDIYELVLAQIYVGVGVTSITAANITDKRPDSSVCGYVMSTIQTPDFSELYAQFQAQAADALQSQETDFDSWKQNFEDDAEEWEDTFQETAQNWYQVNTSDFAAWFESIKDQLDTDQAGHLQLEIEALRDSIAKEYNPLYLYAVGDYCIHDGKLYKYINTSGLHILEWQDEDWELATLAPDVSGKANSKAMAAEYKSSDAATATEGVLRSYNGKLFRRNSTPYQHTTSDENPEGKTTWDEITIDDVLASLSNQIAEQNSLILKEIVSPSAAFAIPSSGSSVSYNLDGITTEHELLRWNFSSSAENYPPADLSWVTYAGYFTIKNESGTTSESIRPVFGLPTKKTVTTHN